MTAAKVQRNRRSRDLRRDGMSQRQLAKFLGISRRTVRGILESSGGDPMTDLLVARATDAQLRRRRRSLVERLGADIRRLVAIDEELDVRANDRILGLG